MTTSFEELLNSSEMLKKGDKVTGTVSKIDNDKVYVDVAGAQYDCVILRNQITRKPFENIEDVLSVGDEVEAQVTGIRADREKRSEDVPGVIYLSHKILENAEYKKLMELSWTGIIEKFENGELIQATVSGQTKGGLLADVEGLRAFIPGSYIDTKFRKDLSKFVGNEYTFKIEEVDKSKNKIILNRRVILEEEKAKKLAEVYGNINEGDVIEGKVSRITDFGAFVNIGEVDGLLHISEISHARVEKVSDVLSVGDTVKVAVIAVDKENEKVSLSAKTLLPTQWEVARATIKAGDVLEGVVRNTTAFGAFVEVLPDVEGLVHISQISHDRVTNVEDVLKKGDKVNVKVLEFDFENERLSLSIKELLEKPVKEEVKEEGLFSSDMLAQLNTVFGKMEKDILLKVFVKDDDVSKELLSYMNELGKLTDKISVKEVHDETKAPVVEIYKDGEYSGLAFHGVPGGHEFTSFILGIYNVSGPGQGLSDDIREKILKIKDKVSFKILVSLSCTMCPDLVVAVQRIASLNPNIDAQVYDINHFGDLREKYHVMSVPCLVMNEDKVFFGKKSIEEVLEYINN